MEESVGALVVRNSARDHPSAGIAISPVLTISLWETGTLS